MSTADETSDFDDAAVLTPEQIAELLAGFDAPPELPDFPPDEDDGAQDAVAAQYAVPVIHRAVKRAPHAAPARQAGSRTDVEELEEHPPHPELAGGRTTSEADAARALSWLFR